MSFKLFEFCNRDLQFEEKKKKEEEKWESIGRKRGAVNVVKRCLDCPELRTIFFECS